MSEDPPLPPITHCSFRYNTELRCHNSPVQFLRSWHNKHECLARCADHRVLDEDDEPGDRFWEDVPYEVAVTSQVHNS